MSTLLKILTITMLGIGMSAHAQVQPAALVQGTLKDNLAAQVVAANEHVLDLFSTLQTNLDEQPFCFAVDIRGARIHGLLEMALGLIDVREMRDVLPELAYAQELAFIKQLGGVSRYESIVRMIERGMELSKELSCALGSDRKKVREQALYVLRAQVLLHKMLTHDRSAPLVVLDEAVRRQLLTADEVESILN